MDNLTQEYGEFTITYNEHNDLWTGNLCGTEVHRSSKLSDLKKALDRHHEKEYKFTRVPIFKRACGFSSPENWTDGEITSQTAEGHFWVTWKDGGRSKVGQFGAHDLFAVTAANLDARKNWDGLQAKIDVLQADQEKLMNRMRPVKVKQAAENGS